MIRLAGVDGRSVNSGKTIINARLARGPKLTDVIARQIRRQIVLGEIKEGEFLPPEAELVEQFGVSRPTMREALRVLEAESLIKPRRGAHTGAMVCAPSVELSARYTGIVLEYLGTQLAEVHEAQMLIEPFLAGRAAARASDESIAQLEAMLSAEAERIADPIAFARASLAFHEAVIDLAEQKPLAVTAHQYYWVLGAERKLRGAARSPQEATRNNKRAHRAHEKFMEIFRQRDGAAAEEFWRKHLSATTESLAQGHESDAVIDVLDRLD